MLGADSGPDARKLLQLLRPRARVPRQRREHPRRERGRARRAGAGDRQRQGGWGGDSVKVN